MNAKDLASTLTSTAMAWCLLGTVPDAGAVETFTASTGAEPSGKARKTHQPKAPQAPAKTGSAESKAERDKRLLRECRGRPNAGACEGYAS